MTARTCDICGGMMRPEPDGNTKRLVCVECDTPLTPANDRQPRTHFSVAGFARAVDRGLRNGPKSDLQAKAGS